MSTTNTVDGGRTTSPTPKLRPKIGLLTTGHAYYWPQFPELKKKGMGMYAKLCEQLEIIGDVVTPGLVDTVEDSRRAGEIFQHENVDIVLVFPLGYCTGMVMVPAIKDLRVPMRILNAHEDRRYDYASADTAEYLHHEGVCCIPEFSGALVNMDKKFRVRTGPFDDARLWSEIRADAEGAAVARFVRDMAVGLIGNTYTNMVDMPFDEHRLLRATGSLLVRPEVEEITEAFHEVTDEETKDMLRQFRLLYDVDETVTDEHLSSSAQIAVAFDKIILRYDLHAFGYYWWGRDDLITQLRAQSGLAVSRLAALGRPGVTEGDVRTAIAMKVFDLLDAGGMFVEFFAMDFDDNTILFGHDGPSNVNMAKGRPRLMHLDIHHGKSGHGLGIDFETHTGPVTILNITEFDAGETFKLIYSVGEVVQGDILKIGNPNCRIKMARPIHEFMDVWCQQGPAHHMALGMGDQSQALEAFAEAMGFRAVRV